MSLFKFFAVLLVLAVSSVSTAGQVEPKARLLMLALESSDPGIRERACMALRDLGADARVAVPALMGLSGTDRDPNVREEAVKTLGLFVADSGAAAEAVLHALSDVNRSVRLAALGALAEPENPKTEWVAPVVGAMLADRTRPLQTAGAAVLGRFSVVPAGALPAVLALLKAEDNGDVQLGVDLAASLTVLLSDADAAVVADSVRKVALRGVRAAGTESTALTVAAIAALREKADPEMVRFLVRQAGRDDRSARYLAIDALAGLYDLDEAQEILRKAARGDADFRVRTMAAGHLNPEKDPEAAIVLEELLKDSSSLTREAALAKIDAHADVARLLCAALTDKTRDTATPVRMATARALRHCDRTEATPGLLVLAKDVDADVRTGAVTNLGELWKSAVDSSFGARLMARMGSSSNESDEPGPWQTDELVPDDVVDAILAAAADPEAVVADAAGGALEEVLPLNDRYAKATSVLAFGRDGVGSAKSSKARLAALRALASFGAAASAEITAAHSVLRQMNARTFDVEERDAFEDRLVEAIGLIAPGSGKESEIGDDLRLAYERRRTAEVLHAISRIGAPVPDAFVRSVALDFGGGDDVEKARYRFLKGVPGIDKILSALVLENEVEEKTAKPLDQVRLFEDHPTYRLRRLNALKEEIHAWRPRELKLRGRDGVERVVAVGQREFFLAVGTWCGHSQRLFELLNNQRFRRLIPQYTINYVFDNEWPIAEEQLRDQVAAGETSAQEARDLLAAAKQRAGNSPVIHPPYLASLGERVWFAVLGSADERLRPIPGVFEPVANNFERDQTEFVSDDLLIPKWITDKVTW